MLSGVSPKGHAAVAVTSPTPVSHDPGAAVPVRLDPAREPPRLDVQLSRQSPERHRNEKLEAHIFIHSLELLPRWSLRGRAERAEAATATAMPLRPHIQASTALPNEIDRRIGRNNVHQQRRLRPDPGRAGESARFPR
jgi:hypothetical protein